MGHHYTGRHTDRGAQLLVILRLPHSSPSVTMATSMLQLTIESFDVEESSKCSYDYLTIYNGPSQSSPVLDKICKVPQPNTKYTSAGNRLRLEFITDYSQSGNGFKISYRQKQSGNLSPKLYLPPHPTYESAPISPHPLPSPPPPDQQWRT